ncbi:MAG TPA: tetratricopeptide repeat protein [Candidatus Methylomirabilis sp.]|nr:tetratricopeptide repeat protein [Candidatus Methylomirabilis sp.]
MGGRVRTVVIGVAMCVLAACAGPEAEQARQESARVHYDIGIGALAENNTTKAISELQTSVQEDPQNARGFHALGVAYFRSDQNDRAIAAFRRALELNPNLLDVYNDLGVAYMRQQMWDPAIESFRKALANPQNTNPERAYMYLGDIYYIRKQYDLAAEEFRKLQDVLPQSPDGYFLMGRTLLAQGKVAEARDQIEQAIKINNTIPIFHFELGLALMREGNRAGARQSFRRVLELTSSGREAEESRRYLRELN